MNDRETVRIRAVRDVTVVLPAGEIANVLQDHVFHIVNSGFAELVETDEDPVKPKETKPVKPKETKPVKPTAR